MQSQDIVFVPVDELQVGMYVHLDLKWFEHPFAFNHFKIKDAEQIAVIRSLGVEKVRRNEAPSMAAEDFSYMLRKKPGCYVWLSNGPETGGCTLHNPHYDFNDQILGIGVSYWVRLVETALRPA